MVLNVSVYVDSGNSQEADLSLGDLKISLYEKAYGYSSEHCTCPDGYPRCDEPCADMGTYLICQGGGNHIIVYCN